MRPTTFVTAVERARVAGAVASARSFLAVHPGARAVVVVADALELAPVDGVELLTGPDVAGGAFARLASALAGRELAAALMPYALAGVRAPAVFLAPDAEVLAPIELPDDGFALAASGDARAGVADDGFVGWAAGDGAPLAWWRSELDALRLPERPLDELAGRFGEVALVHAPGWAVASWNAEERGLHVNGTVPALAGGEPVVWLRATADDAGALGAAAARRAGADAAAAGPFDAMAEGTPITARLRGLYARGARDGELTEGVFAAAGARAFATWLADPSPQRRHGGLNRYLADLRDTREDLRQLYPDVEHDEAARRGFLEWVHVHGRAELEIPGWLVPPPALEQLDASAPTFREPVAINVAGYFDSEVGVGETARRMVRALDAASVPLLPVQPTLVPSSRRRADATATVPEAAAFPFTLCCVNADGMADFAADVGPDFFRDRYTIGLWWWELPDFPAAMHGAFEHLDEVWVGSQFCQDAIAPVAPVPVVHVPIPLRVPEPPSLTRAELGLPEGFLVMVAFDFHSVMERKNPLGAIEAFRRAFPTPDDGAHLVLKAINGDKHPAELQRLQLAVSEHADVHLVDRYVTSGERDAMLASCDAFLSVHRSEGLGQILGEAMALGRPVVATGWSGNLEFMDADGAWLVPYALVDVGPGNAPYDPASRWADPDLDAAARALREIREDPAGAAARAARGQARVRDEFTGVACGTAMRQRLEALHPRVLDMRRAAVPPLAAKSRAALEHARGRQRELDGELPIKQRVRALSREVSQRVATRAGLSRVDELIDAVGEVNDALVRELTTLRDAHAGLTAASLARQRRDERRIAELEAELSRRDPPGRR